MVRGAIKALDTTSCRLEQVLPVERNDRMASEEDCFECQAVIAEGCEGWCE